MSDGNRWAIIRRAFWCVFFFVFRCFCGVAHVIFRPLIALLPTGIRRLIDYTRGVLSGAILVAKSDEKEARNHRDCGLYLVKDLGDNSAIFNPLEGCPHMKPGLSEYDRNNGRQCRRGFGTQILALIVERIFKVGTGSPARRMPEIV